ncbi:MAG TPA: ABC transporter ATP-binding protein [Longimicrobiales bacterium]|nr:ABC transporter ATP-binding protein [Longimicrobiales bacterium]
MSDGPDSRAASDGNERRPTLIAESLEIRRGATVIVSGFTWTHEAGHVAWLVGPNGAGKSSLMRVLARLEPAAAGRVTHLGGHADSDSPAEASRRGACRVGYYHPSMSLPGEVVARSFTRLGDRLVPHDKPLAPDRALGRKRCADLSTGEEKRLLLGQILARARDFLLLDEPYEHLSGDARLELTDALTRLARRSAVVVATNQEVPDRADGPVLRLTGTGILT